MKNVYIIEKDNCVVVASSGIVASSIISKAKKEGYLDTDHASALGAWSGEGYVIDDDEVRVLARSWEGDRQVLALDKDFFEIHTYIL